MALLPMICLVLVFSSQKLRLEILTHESFFTDAIGFVCPTQQFFSGFTICWSFWWPSLAWLSTLASSLASSQRTRISTYSRWAWVAFLQHFARMGGNYFLHYCTQCWPMLLKWVNFSSHNMNSAFTNDWFSMDSCLEKNWDWRKHNWHKKAVHQSIIFQELRMKNLA